MTGVALAIGTSTAVGIGTSVAASQSAKSGAKKASNATIAGNNKAIQSLFEQLMNSNNALQSGYNSNLPVQQGVLNASLGYQDPYSTAGKTALQSLMGQIAPREARAASGTLPEEAARIQAQAAQAAHVEQAAQSRVASINQQLSGLQWSPATAQQIVSLQAQLRDATTEMQNANNKATVAQAQVQSIVPYQAAQEAVLPQDATFNRQFTAQDYSNDPTTGGSYQVTPATKRYESDFNQGNSNISAQQIKEWLGSNQGATDAQILDAMQQNGISAQQMSEATGSPIDQITARINAANVGTPETRTWVPSNTPPPDLTKNFDQSAWLANQGKTEQDLTKNFDSAGYLAKGGKTEGDLFRNFTMQDYQADPGYQFRLDQGNKAINNSAAARGGLLSGATLKAIAEYNSGAASQEYGAAQGRFAGNQALAQNAQNTAYNQFGQDRNNLQGAQINAFNQFGSNRDNASNVYQNAYSRWNDQNNTIFNRLSSLSGMGQTAATNQGGYQQNFGANMQNAQQNLSTGIANNYQNYGTNQANLLSNNGQALSNQAIQTANATGGMYQGIGNAVNSGVTNATGAYMQNQTNDLLKQYLMKSGSIR